LFLVEGLVLMLLGIGAILIPALASIAVAVFMGWLFLIGGLVGLATTLMGRYAPGFVWSLISALVAIGAGVMLLASPVFGAVSLTLVLAAYLGFEGVVLIFYAIDHRRQLSARWAWLVVNGLIDIGLAVAIIWLLPGAALWVLGLFLGIDFFFGGAALTAMALAARNPA
jgi:uncharacterized membrane protein HdeD (DUF308 family)